MGIVVCDYIQRECLFSSTQVLFDILLYTVFLEMRYLSMIKEVSQMGPIAMDIAFKSS